MKLSQILTGLVAAQTISAASIPESNALNVLGDRRVVPASELVSPDHTLERRKGGGGRGGGSSGGSSGGGRSGGSGGGAPGRTSPTSNAGGATSAGSGRPRTFGGGRYYGGGAAVPYTAGSKTPKGLIAGALILPATMLLIMPGLWLYSTYPYYYNNPYRFYNQSATNDDDDDNNNDRRGLWTRQTQGRNETLPVMCVCSEGFVCGCDENDDQQYINDLVGNGSYAALNKTLVTVSDVNGTKTLVLNGTLEKGTTAPGGSDEDSAAISLKFGKYAGCYALGMMVFAGVLM
ncbi:hypothetical protein ACET3X_006679 [Alternaria dauci]|uniref:DUF7732 domain-containing protein n=1 Tax=Alternaria dauci TaxID=48095 RepID=A0ABR3UFU6_9PLEO